MKTLIKIAALALTTLMSSNALAVKYGTDIAEEDYKDYFVSIYNDDSLEACGGQMITPQWLLTAAHCTPYSNTMVNPTSEYGSEMNIRIYQGVEGRMNYRNKTYEGVGFVYSLSATELQSIADEMWQPIIDKLNSIFYRDKTSTVMTNPKSDLALIKLDSEIEYNDTFTIKSYLDLDSIEKEIDSLIDINNIINHALLVEGEEVTFKGWGINESNRYPDVMQSGTFTLQSQPLTTTCRLRMPTIDRDPLDCTEDNLNTWVEAEGYWSSFNIVVNDQITFADYENLTQTGGGDSGTGLLKSEELYGLVSSGGNYSPTSTFQTLTYHMDWILETVNTISAPSHARVLVGTEEYNFQIQNLSPQAEVVAPYTNANDLQISHDCPQTIEPLESCTIIVSGKGFEQVDLIKEIYINQTTTVKISTFEVIDETDEDDNENLTDETLNDEYTSNGGSLNLMVILMLLPFVFIRRKF